MEHYLALFEPDLKAGGYTVTFPDFGYGVTQGETDDEAMDMARDLLMLTVGDYIREGKRLPAPARRRGTKFRAIPLPALQSAKVDLYTAFLESGLKKAEFARRSVPASAMPRSPASQQIDCTSYRRIPGWPMPQRTPAVAASSC